ncbi:polyhydroxyalkanoate synthesis repressor PhaR [Hyphomonas sp. FCG-A18]|jgi:polyhydroxyalkanoate synthesis repressor PhaR|uniref:polyhydroxyalkanoate synthesis repressor PhaR n=1 Tax=Hyphomonas sp. FCG-A18 TaxID=3080019 RepID=UPI002B2E9A6E|nr:polyhydroxyalkanoate synthesis repressor PhaR [Hyphomonas sp. FCG-A18]
MAKSGKGDDTVIIKKYANRRLYDTSTSSYVTLDHLSELVRREVDFEVRDAKTGEDLTRQVLTQIIFEKETKGEGALPVNFLRQLIGFYGGQGANSLLPAWLEMSMNSFAESRDRWGKAMTGGMASPFGLFEQQAKANMAMFDNAMKMFTPTMPNAKSAKTRKTEKAAPDADDPMSLLRAQMEAMQAQLDALAGKD